MSKLPLGSLFKILFEGKSSRRFLIGTISGFSFSMAIILCTIGLMDGFEISLKKALSHSNGDIKFASSQGYFPVDDSFKTSFSETGIKNYTTLVQIESFAIVGEQSRGVLLKGINAAKYSEITRLDFNPLQEGIIIGEVFAKKHNLSIGDPLTLAIASNKSRNQGGAILIDVIIDGVVKHGIYEKDLRFIYIDKNKLLKQLGYKKGIANVGYIKIDSFKNINLELDKYEQLLGDNFRFEPYWSEFEVLLDAVEIEKFTITLILQLIVIVAVLNIIAFIVYLSETKSQDFFMLRALGLNLKSFQKFWFYILFLIWLVSCFSAVILKYFFAYLITNLPFLKIPGDIYVMSELEVIVDSIDYIYVFGISLVWITLIGFIMIKRMKNKSLVEGLRQEFS